MASVPAGFPAGVRVSDHISLGVIAKAFPHDRVQQVLAEHRQLGDRPACNNRARRRTGWQRPLFPATPAIASRLRSSAAPFGSNFAFP